MFEALKLAFFSSLWIQAWIQIRHDACTIDFFLAVNIYEHLVSNEPNSNTFPNRLSHFYAIHLTTTAWWKGTCRKTVWLVETVSSANASHLMKLFHLFRRAFLMNLFSRSVDKGSRWRVHYASAQPPWTDDSRTQATMVVKTNWKSSLRYCKHWVSNLYPAIKDPVH